MKFKIEKNTFTKILKSASDVINNNSLNPVLTGILIECKQNQLFITASNNNLSIKAKETNVEIEKEGKLLIRGKVLYGVVSKLKNDKITLEVVDNSIVRVSTTKFSSDINIMDDVTYPAINFQYENWQKIVIKTSFLRQVVNKLINTTTFDINKTTPLNGILFDASRQEKQIECVGTDGYHLSYISDQYLGQKFKIIININDLKSISEFIESETEMVWYLNNMQLIVVINNISFNIRLIEGNFPSSLKFLELTYPNLIKIKKMDLANAIERSLVFVNLDKKPSVLLNITPGVLKISSRSVEFGNSYEELPIEGYEGENFSVSFNIKYLQNLIRNIDSDDINIHFINNNKPFMLKDDKNPQYTSLIQPIRII